MKSSVDFTKYLIPTLDKTNFGQNLKRIMYLLNSSTAANPSKIRIAYTGQSIVDPSNTWPNELTAWLKETYPTAKITTHNFAIGGFATNFLYKRMPNDIASFYPDLVICYVKGSDIYYDQMIKYIRENTMADIMIQTDHICMEPDGYEWSEIMALKKLPHIAQKYRAEICDTRKPWKDFLLKYGLDMNILLYDGSHLNESGQKFMLELMKQFFVYQEDDMQSSIETQYICISLSDWQKNKLAIPFTGNRVELVYGDRTQSAVHVRINGKKPSEIKEAYIRTTENKGMWSKLGLIHFNKPPGEQIFTIKINSFSDSNNFSYSVSGSKTGYEGTSDDYGNLDSEHLSMTHESFIFHPGTDNPTPGQEYTFESLLNGTDIHDGINPYAYHPEKNMLFDKDMLISGIPTNKHLLELEAVETIPDIRAIKVYGATI